MHFITKQSIALFELWVNYHALYTTLVQGWNLCACELWILCLNVLCIWCKIKWAGKLVHATHHFWEPVDRARNWILKLCLIQRASNLRRQWSNIPKICPTQQVRSGRERQSGSGIIVYSCPSWQGGQRCLGFMVVGAFSSITSSLRVSGCLLHEGRPVLNSSWVTLWITSKSEVNSEYRHSWRCVQCV